MRVDDSVAQPPWMHHAQDGHGVRVVAIEDDMMPERMLSHAGTAFAPDIGERLNSPGRPLQFGKVRIALGTTPAFHGVPEDVADVCLRVWCDDESNT